MFIKQDDSQTVHPITADLQPADIHLILPNTPNPTPTDSFDRILQVLN